MNTSIVIQITAAQLDAVRLKLAHLDPVMADIGAVLKDEARLRFIEQSSPEGDAWQPLSTATLANKRRGKNAKILRDTGVLMNSIAYKSGTDSVSVGSAVIYAAIHQFGGQAGKGKKVYIPARPFFPTNGLPDDQLAEVVGVLESYLQ